MEGNWYFWKLPKRDDMKHSVGTIRQCEVLKRGMITNIHAQVSEKERRGVHARERKYGRGTVHDRRRTNVLIWRTFCRGVLQALDSSIDLSENL
jgi:hypothetical protein